MCIWIECRVSAAESGLRAVSLLNVREPGSGTDRSIRSNSMAYCPRQPVSPHSEEPADALVHPAGHCSDNLTLWFTTYIYISHFSLFESRLHPWQLTKKETRKNVQIVSLQHWHTSNHFVQESAYRLCLVSWFYPLCLHPGKLTVVQLPRQCDVYSCGSKCVNTPFFSLNEPTTV